MKKIGCFLAIVVIGAFALAVLGMQGPQIDWHESVSGMTLRQNGARIIPVYTRVSVPDPNDSWGLDKIVTVVGCRILPFERYQVGTDVERHPTWDTVYVWTARCSGEIERRFLSPNIVKFVN